VLEILGGADLSEQFDVKGINETLRPSPGMVVSIDKAKPGNLVISNKAYDKRVAGIVSGAGGVNPGMLMGQEGRQPMEEVRGFSWPRLLLGRCL